MRNSRVPAPRRHLGQYYTLTPDKQTNVTNAGRRPNAPPHGLEQRRPGSTEPAHRPTAVRRVRSPPVNNLANDVPFEITPLGRLEEEKGGLP
jgi:hypothetical protein